LASARHSEAGVGVVGVPVAANDAPVVHLHARPGRCTTALVRTLKPSRPLTWDQNTILRAGRARQRTQQRQAGGQAHLLGQRVIRLVLEPRLVVMVAKDPERDRLASRRKCSGRAPRREARDCARTHIHTSSTATRAHTAYIQQRRAGGKAVQGQGDDAGAPCPARGEKCFDPPLFFARDA